MVIILFEINVKKSISHEYIFIDIYGFVNMTKHELMAKIKVHRVYIYRVKHRKLETSWFPVTEDIRNSTIDFKSQEYKVHIMF